MHIYRFADAWYENNNDSRDGWKPISYNLSIGNESMTWSAHIMTSQVMTTKVAMCYAVVGQHGITVDL